MIVIDKTIVSDELLEEYFICDLLKCKGGCCVEGDLGAPLEESELEKLEKDYDKIVEYLTEDGKKEIRRQGKYILDEDGDFSTPTIGGKECAYAFYDQQGILKCGIEKAFQEGKTDFRKPVSCHLYPVRVSKYENYEAVNYDRWHICKPACAKGKKAEVPLYRFLKDSLIRKFGEEWYEQLEAVAKDIFEKR